MALNLEDLINQLPANIQIDGDAWYWELMRFDTSTFQVRIMKEESSQTDFKNFVGETAAEAISSAQEWLKEKTEPKILSADDAFMKRYTSNSHQRDWLYFQAGYIDGDKNGQRKDRSRTQPLINAVKVLDSKAIHSQLSKITRDVIVAAKNIKLLEN